MVSVGKNVPRKEGPQKLCGLAKYIDDYDFKDCLYGVTFRSSIPHGLIKKISFDSDFPWQEYVIATAQDIPGPNVVALIENDQPLLADKKILHPMEPILLVSHPILQKAYAALEHIRVDYEELPAVLTLEESLSLEQVLYPPDNVFKKFQIQKGNVEAGFAQADFIVEGEYRVPHQEQTYIENNGVAAYVENGTIVVMGSMQCPYYVHKALKHIFNVPDEKLRIIQTTTGGGFGGKEEYPNMIAGHAALLALKSGRPVKMIYDRQEDMAATTKRHPAWIKHRTGVTKEGKLVAQEIEVVMDGGAYVTLSPVVLSRGTLHATGPYECPNVRVVSKTAATNTPPNGAFRGFGAPQTLFAAELHWEKIAEAVGLDSLTLRRLNVFKEGSQTATGQILGESVGASEVLERAVTRSRYISKRKEYSLWNRDKKKESWRGMGLALVHHGAGFTGSGEVYLASRAGVAFTNKGQVKVLAASTEIGQGTISMFAQIVADSLGIPYEWVVVVDPDTGQVPNSGPTVASRTCMVVGGLIQKATLQLKQELSRHISKKSSWSQEDLKEAARKMIPPPAGEAELAPSRRSAGGGMMEGQPEKKYIVEYEKPKEIQWDDKTYKGDAYAVYSYACAVVDLEVDKLTYEVKIHKITTAQDIGKAIHPLLAEGQIMGGTAQAVGYALYENVVMKNGVMQNAQLTNYIIPTFMDTPPMDIEIVEKPYSHGPFGAKGVGELPMDVPAPAIAAAIHHATGLWIPELPILPEKIFKVFFSSPLVGEGRVRGT
ncbi:MAG: xanthine dehydrogenase family protein [Elusimicrobia bacterium]|nr:xanthine dehydrogenase family protein [Elusimicrobiota bacterium]